jgi:hypothetical protein
MFVRLAFLSPERFNDEEGFVMLGSVNRAHADYMEKYQKGEDTARDYVNLQLGSAKQKHEKLARESKIAERQKDELNKISELLRSCQADANEDVLHSVSGGNEGPIISSNPAAVEYLGGNDELAEQISFFVTRFRESGVLISTQHTADAQLTAEQAAAVISDVEIHTVDEGGVSVDLPWPLPDAVESQTMQDIAERINNQAGALLRALVVERPDGFCALTVTLRKQSDRATGYFTCAHVSSDGDVVQLSSFGAYGEGTLYSYSLLGEAFVAAPPPPDNTIRFGDGVFRIKGTAPENNPVRFQRGASGDATVAEVRGFLEKFNATMKAVHGLVNEKRNPSARLLIDLHPENMSRQETKDAEEAEQKVARGALSSSQAMKTFLRDVRAASFNFNFASYGLAKRETKDGLKFEITDERKLVAALQTGIPAVGGWPAVSAADARQRLVAVRDEEGGKPAGFLMQLMEAANASTPRVTSERHAATERYASTQADVRRMLAALLQKEAVCVAKYYESNAKMQGIQSQLDAMRAFRDMLFGSNNGGGLF